MEKDLDNFIGAHITDDQANGLALATVVLGETRSALIRHAIADYLSTLQSQGSLVERMAKRLNGEWQVSKASSTDNQSLKRFQEQATIRLEKAGVADDTIVQVLERLKALADASLL